MPRFDETKERTIRAVQSLHFLSSDSSADHELPVEKNRSRNWLKTLRGATRDSGDTEYDTAESFEANVGGTAQTPIANKYSTQRKMSGSTSVAINSAPSTNVYPISSTAGTPIAMSSAVSGTSLPQLVQLTQMERISQNSSQTEGESPETDETVNLTGQMPEIGSAKLGIRSPPGSAHLLQWGSNLDSSTIRSPENEINPRRSVTFEKSPWVPSPSPISDSSTVPSAQDTDNDKTANNSPIETAAPDNNSETITDDRTMHSARSSTATIELAKRQNETPLQENDSSFDENSGTDADSKSGKSMGTENETKDKRRPFSIAFTNWKVWVIYIITGLLLASLTINILQLVLKRHGTPPTTSLVVSAPNSTADTIIYTKDHPSIKPLLNDKRLKKSFHGINYVPPDMDERECNIDAENIGKDIALLSQLTNRVRLYTTDCNLPDLVLDAVQSLNANMTVSLGLKMDRNLDVSIKQLSDFKRIITNYPEELINSVWIGEEAVSKGQLSEFELIGYLDFATGYLERTGKQIPVGTSEIGSQWSPNLANHVSIIGVNINPFFGGLEANLSTLWTYDFLLEEFVNRLDIRDTTAQLVISEVGWPTEGGAVGDAKANEDQLQNFMDLWICNNKDSQVGWYWHTAFDGPSDRDKQWENHWGLLNNDRLLKNITVPVC